MAIYVRCKGNGGKCKTFNSPEVKRCRKCGANLDELKANGASYYVYVRIDGKLKPKSFPTLKKAQAYEAEVEKKKAEGKEYELKFEMDLTVSRLCDWYLQYREEGHGKNSPIPIKEKGYCYPLQTEPPVSEPVGHSTANSCGQLNSWPVLASTLPLTALAPGLPLESAHSSGPTNWYAAV